MTHANAGPPALRCNATMVTDLVRDTAMAEAPPAASALIAGAVIAGAVAWLEMLRLAAGRLRRSGVSPPASTG